MCTVLVPASVAAVDPGGLVPAGQLRTTVVVVGVLLLAAGLAFDPLQRRGKQLSPVGGIGIALLFWLLVATLQGVDPWHGLVGTPDRRFGFLAWALVIGCVCLGTRMQAEREHVTKGLVLAAAVIAGVSCLQLAGWEPPGSAAADWRWSGLYGQPAYLGSAALFFGFVAAGVALDAAETLRWRLLGAFGGAGCLTALVGSGTRGALVGLAAGVVAAGCLLGGSLWSRWTGTAATVALLVVGLLGREFSRFDEWGIGLRALREAPFVGFGPEGYRTVFGRFVTEDYVRTYGSDVFTDRAHSGLLDLALVGGIPAVGLFVAGMGLVATCVYRARAKLMPSHVGLAAGVFGYVVAQQALFPVISLEPFVGLSIGVLYAQGKSCVGVESLPPTEYVGFKKTGQMASGVGALAAALVVAYIGGREVLAERRLAAEAQTRVVDQDVVLEAVELAPRSIRVRYAAAQLLASGETLLDLDAGLEQLEQGLEISPNDPALGIRRVELLIERASRSDSDTDRAAAWAAAQDLVNQQPRSSNVLRLASEAADLAEEDG